MVTTNFMKF